MRCIDISYMRYMFYIYIFLKRKISFTSKKFYSLYTQAKIWTWVTRKWLGSELGRAWPANSESYFWRNILKISLRLFVISRLFATLNDTFADGTTRWPFLISLIFGRFFWIFSLKFFSGEFSVAEILILPEPKNAIICYAEYKNHQKNNQKAAFGRFLLLSINCFIYNGP